MKNSIIYLDNAATTFPKPRSVARGVSECIEKFCGNPSRGSNPLAMKCAEAVYECRDLISQMFGCSPEGVVFTHNTTYALNMAIKGVMKGGGHMLISNMEHNATLRPVAQLERDGLIDYSVFETYGRTDEEIICEVDTKIRPDTRALCAIHTSNICSYALPISKLGKLCRERGIIFICDAAQAAGHADIDMRRDCIDILCMPAHKGLYGTQGLGMMLLSDGILPDTVVEGGNGINSLELFMGDVSPERYEAGTLNTPAIVGLKHGLEFIRRRGIDDIASHEISLFRYAKARLESMKRIRLYDEVEGSTLLFNINGIPSDEVGRILSEHGICVRTGFHCSPLAHRALGTDASGGVRISFGAFNTSSHVDALCELVGDISRHC